MRTIFLDFYGLPGCGKSTVSHIVAKKLKDSGMKTKLLMIVNKGD